MKYYKNLNNTNIEIQDFIKLSDEEEFPIYIFKKESSDYKIKAIENYQEAFYVANSEDFCRAFPLEPVKIKNLKNKMEKRQFLDGDIVGLNHILELFNKQIWGTITVL